MTAEAAVDLGALLDGFTGLARRFADLDFVDRGGRLDLRCRLSSVTTIRVELPSTQMLRLRSVIIEADGMDDPVRQTTRTASSALTAEYAAVLQTGRLLRRKNKQLGVHTRREPRPWLEIEFERPFDVRRILLRNSSDEGSIRARGLQLLVRSGDGCWTTVYDGLAREREFARSVERSYRRDTLPRRIATKLRRRPEPDRARVADLGRILTAVQLRDYANANKDMKRLDLPAAQDSRFRELVSDQIVARRQLEWTSHGIKRSFRFWTEQEKQDYVGFALEVVDRLRQLNENVCFGFGSALSVVRDHDLIPHDDDLDILIGFERSQAATLTEARRLVRDCLQEKGFVVEGRYTSFWWVFPPGRAGQKVDAFVGLFEDDSVSWYPGRRGALTRQMMFPPRTMPLLGFDCPVPREPEQYLQQIYGPHWATPDPHFRHSWDRSAYADLVR